MKYYTCCFLLLALCLCPFNTNAETAQAPTFHLEEGLTAQDYIDLGYAYLNQARHDECVAAANKAIQLKPDATMAYRLLCSTYLVQKFWDKSIAAGEKALSLDPSLLGTPDFVAALSNAYKGKENWKALKNFNDEALKKTPNSDPIKTNLKIANDNLANLERSKVITIAIILIFIIGLFYSRKNFLSGSTGNSVSELLIISAAVSAGLYFVFFAFATYIRSFNLKLPAYEFTPVIRFAIFDHDGLEGYSLFLLFLGGMIAVLALSALIVRYKTKASYLWIFLPLLAAGAIFIYTIQFIPPQFKTGDSSSSDFTSLFVAVILLLGALLVIQKYFPQMVFWLATLLLIPICFVTTSALSIPDYSYILAPALRIIHGFPLSQIYFQYDLYLSLLGAAWMKLKLDLNHFQVLGQLSFFLFILGTFWFSRKLFSDKKLSIFLLFTMVIFRYYAVKEEPVSLLQVTPLRLDLWLILLVAVYFKGPYHWIIGLLLGALILLHKNFGLIYFISYSAFITFLAVSEAPLGKGMGDWVQWLKSQLLHVYKNVLIIIAFIATSFIIFKGFTPESMVLYQKLGINMLPISRYSFYWFMPIVLGLTAALLQKQKKSLPPAYFLTGAFLLLLTVGNSMYFYGRSHENNILNIAGVLVLTTFLMIDLVLRSLPKAKAEQLVAAVNLKTKKKPVKKSSTSSAFISKQMIASTVIPLVIVLGATYYYSDRIIEKTKTKYENISKGQFIYPLGNYSYGDFNDVKQLTANSPNVYFLNFSYDFMYDYLGDYTPVGYFSPLASWPFMKDLAVFLQDLLDKHYYLVTNTPQSLLELLPKLSYNKMVEKNNFTVYSKESTESLMPQDTGQLAHVSISAPLAKSGMVMSPIHFKNSFTIEALVKPSDKQIANAALMGNAALTGKFKGVMLIENNNAQNRFLFAYGDSKKWVSSDFFQLEPNTWNYVVITGNWNKINIYNNGKLVSAKENNPPIKNSDDPLVIGNMYGQSLGFNGWIREVKMTNSELPQDSIVKNTEYLLSKLK